MKKGEQMDVKPLEDGKSVPKLELPQLQEIMSKGFDVFTQEGERESVKGIMMVLIDEENNTVVIEGGMSHNAIVDSFMSLFRAINKAVPEVGEYVKLRMMLEGSK